MKEVINIALVSTNRNKFSETFIHNHLFNLEGNVHFLFDGYLPTKYSKDRGLSFSSFLKFKSIFKKFSNKNEDIDKKRLAQRIKSYLIRNKIQVILCEYGPSGVEMMEIATECSIPLLVHFHGYDAYRKDVLMSYGKKYTQLFSIAKAVIVVSKHMFKQLEILKCPSSKLQLVNYGIDLKLFKPIQNKVTLYDFIFCGRFVDKKGPQHIIHAFNILWKQFPRIKMCMIGDGHLLEDCKMLVSKLGLTKQISFTGILSPQQVANALNQSKIFLLNSNTTDDNDSEGLPNSILEAGACGLAVISTFHAGIPEVIDNKQNGILVKEKDEQALVFAMRELLTDTTLCAHIGQNLRFKIEKNYSLEAYSKQLNEIILKSASSYP